MRRNLIWIGLGLALGLMAVGAFFLTRPYQYHGSLIQEDYPAPDFALPDGSGGEFRLSEERGNLVLVFFGYTFCPDVCPTTLSTMRQIHNALGRDAERVKVVFITVDPERDTPAKASEYARYFAPAFYGLSGTEDQLAPVWEDYGVYYQLNKETPEDTAYTVDHSSQVYLVDAGGNLRLTYSFGTPAEQILADVRHLLRRGA
jgi:protein SCO1/2